MTTSVRISAAISPEAKRQLHEFTERHGLKTAFVVEQALLLYMAALRGLPDNAYAPSRIVISEGTFDRVAELLEHPEPATEELRRLLHGS